MIKFESVTCKFVSGSGIEKTSFEVDPGEFVCIIGPTGAGKTTLLRLIYMDIFPEKGKVTVNEFSSVKIKRRRIPYLRRKVGMVFQEFELLEDRSVYENVAIPLHVIGLSIKEIRPRVTSVLEELGIADKSHHLPSELSGGEQQIVSLARAIVKKPIVVLADEPTGNLDPAASLKIVKLLEQINEDGTAVLMATHDYSLVKDRGHRFIEVVQGRVAA
ncbi:MAG: ATP-binding cassette domain-containing protein [Candidatus Marinimicrobia bacterium]|jgi:cell division transport system ATP-binding protein|nr:ATP-binding cassette domain-containing protein [Candidatus Neomarinimicrobiota bacterium]MDP6594161.1 ATP-binding cassette domain-containing protein [Candidatus Neomarinimicrobiota bacterium]MDP6835639.1 ATP-binding cassette domain-containing protein [Candidatus Neomarinimicrobiota bacterium]MDP6966874.1 ATP-binding cassette domain-containing protein [Candidatus Neomarinimicrobiota bacterium]|tara:strand:+ start:5585 stop:6235 length:651 start_codon:yes stop_codon:yes gene_type:complete